ncbi:hypothetical protein CDD81_6901 [Ophiocordyceps australis]|uniref:C2H2-type domain-containing protein n=1 Tax=Ophiocordyceps australis TaxID=1399860 RepID=A0A2C5Y4H4_9HYPO|nr:hypothetical protein CDD81_6901 [Ophiocordyceps australis]
MEKRSAEGQVIEVLPIKRQRTENDDDLYTPDDNGSDQDSTPAQTPASTTDTSLTTATTPRPRFPSDLKTLACTWPGCSKTFNRPARLRDHLNSHTNSRPFKCLYADCDKDYIEEKHLKQHIKAVHTHDRRYPCPRPGCGKSFLTGTRLRRHQAVHDGADRFRCPECGQSFRKRETLHKHLRKDHLGVPTHECSEHGCSEAFNTKPALKRHQDRAHGQVRFWCAECEATTAQDGSQQRVGFTTQLLLEAHLRLEHQNCIFCDYASASKYELQQHIETHHSGKTVAQRKTHACTHAGCDKRFTKKSNLSAHMRTIHQGLRFVCGQVLLSGPDYQGWSNDQGCGDSFKTKANLENHVRFHHLGQKRVRLSRSNVGTGIDAVDALSGFTSQGSHVDANAAAPVLKEPHGLLHLDSERQLFAQDANPSSWSDFMADNAMADDGIFAAQLEYGPVHDEWLDDETNIILLARNLPDDPYTAHIDPSLAGF